MTQRNRSRLEEHDRHEDRKVIQDSIQDIHVHDQTSPLWRVACLEVWGGVFRVTCRRRDPYRPSVILHASCCGGQEALRVASLANMATMREPRHMATGGQSTTAQNIEKKTVSHAATKTMGTTGDRLSQLVDQFQEVYAEVEDGLHTNYSKEEDRLQGVEEYLLRLQRALAVEQGRRVESLKAVEASLNTRLEATAVTCRRQLGALKPDVPERLAAWHERLSEAEIFLEEERVARQRAIERERAKLKKTLADFETQLEIEKVDRLAAETQTLQKVSEEFSGVLETFSGETTRRELTLGHVRDENDEIDAVRPRPRPAPPPASAAARAPACPTTPSPCGAHATVALPPAAARLGTAGLGCSPPTPPHPHPHPTPPPTPQPQCQMRDKPDATFKEAMATRMVRATKDIRQETAMRVHAEQQFVASLESYTQALQDGMRMVNKRIDESGARKPPAKA